MWNLNTLGIIDAHSTEWMMTMKVKDLIKNLESLDPNMEIYGYTEDESLAKQDKSSHIFELDSIDVNIAVTFRDRNGEPAITFGDGKNSRKLALINLSTGF